MLGYGLLGVIMDGAYADWIITDGNSLEIRNWQAIRQKFWPGIEGRKNLQKHYKIID